MNIFKNVSKSAGTMDLSSYPMYNVGEILVLKLTSFGCLETCFFSFKISKFLVQQLRLLLE